MKHTNKDKTISGNPEGITEVRLVTFAVLDRDVWCNELPLSAERVKSNHFRHGIIDWQHEHLANSVLAFLSGGWGEFREVSDYKDLMLDLCPNKNPISVRMNEKRMAQSQTLSIRFMANDEGDRGHIMLGWNWKKKKKEGTQRISPPHY